MDAITAIKNQYLGINAHLHSTWQATGNFSSFHTTHISDLAKAFKTQLRPLGYTADVEQSMQIRRIDNNSANEPEADVMIYDTDEERAESLIYPTISTLSTATQVMALPEILAYPKLSRLKHPALAIYKRTNDKTLRGKPVAWVEILSPSNKVNSRDAALYQAKREKLLRTGIVVLELDYLHESGTLWEKLPMYRVSKKHTAEPHAHPYYIIVVDPRPYYEQGKAFVTGFDVDMPVPKILIPLHGQDIIEFDFNAVYQRTFEEAYYGDDVDYQQLPHNFQRYSPADQTRIVARMIAILKAHQQSVSLENTPLPVDNITLEDGLEQLRHFAVNIPAL